MENKDLKSESEKNCSSSISADDVKLIRSVIENTCRKIDPGWPIMIVWGLIIMIGFPAAYFLKTRQLDIWKWPIYLLLLAISFCVAIYFGAKATMRERKAGLISKLSKQIYWIWFILLANGILWTYLGLFKDHIGGFGFLWTAIYGIAFSMMGILYSREWLYGGIAIFAGIIAAYFTEPYAYYILGVVTGLACIIPAIIAQKNYRKQEKNYER
ncbi:MAG: hypothetical protein K8R02_07245 [Anaerohalosphaeraceae bacterium]|nr:hypothetical protein [Anaerohalosphaeraceae bacterium]